MNLKLTKGQIHLTNGCNLNCAFCDIHERGMEGKDLPEKKVISAVEDLCQLHPRVVTISGGGEPLLRPNLLLEIIKILKSSGIRVGIITNGTLISEEIAKGMVEYCDDFRVSLHSPFAKMDGFLRGANGSVGPSIEGIKRIVYWKKKTKKEWPKIDIGMVLTRFNINQIDQMIRKASFIGADLITLRIVNEALREKKFYPFKNQMKLLKKNIKKYEELAKEHGLYFHYDFLVESIFPQSSSGQSKNQTSFENRFFCMLPFREIVIFADGRVSPCCGFIVRREDCGAVDSIKEKTLTEVWFGEKFENFRKSIIEGAKSNLPDICRECTPDFRFLDSEYRED